MTDTLDKIDTLTADELRGWWRAIYEWKIRPEEPGERAALMSRARAVGVSL